MDSHEEGVVKGRVTRLYPVKGKYYFHTEGDAAAYGYTDYHYVEAADKEVVKILLTSAKRGWIIKVKSTGDKDDKGASKISDLYVDLNYKEDSLFNAV
eukprot:TRINITY_DN223_c0_g1_i1.p2 TRINITY_DN223_c0_g1~~TRINITY_DN223_c0_g1_i1.p2  ORF type:complete len:105 (-),score=17.96 TRINITY_DN223_c0_g1_i1:111-404(-)